MTKINRRAAIATAVALGLARAHAQTGAWPTRPVTLVVPYPPGGQMDVLARLLARQLESSLGQPVLVDNKAGANTLIATQTVARAPADGYTLLVNSSVLVSNPLVMASARYDAFADFVPIARQYDWSVAWVVPPHGPQSIEQFIAKAKAAPTPLTYASPGHGSASHFYAEMFARAAGIPLTHVPYKGEAPIVPDLLQGRVDAAMVTVGLAETYSRDARLRALACSGSRRPQSLRGLRTFAELGIAGLNAESYVGLFAPARTPAGVVERLNAAINAAGALPDVQAQMLANSVEPTPPLSADQFAALVRKSSDEWARIKRETGIRID